MKYKIIYVGEPRGVSTSPIDDRLYNLTIQDENGMELQFDVPVCFTKKSIRIVIETLLHKYNKMKKPSVKVGDII